MQNAIVAKLEKHLAGSMDSEPDAVYLMCEVRKLQEYDDPSRKPTPLRMFAHWALHVDLTSKGTTEPFIKRVDDVVSDFLSGAVTSKGLADQHALIEEFASFDTFRSELGSFLQMHNLPTAICDDDARWFKFLEAYMGVVEDGALLCPLNTVTGVRFSTTASFMRPSNTSFAAKWLISLKTPHKGYNALEIMAQGSGKTFAWNFGLR
jgi:hypothetical protein